MFYNSKSAKKRELGVSGMPSVKSRPPTPYTFTVDGNSTHSLFFSGRGSTRRQTKTPG